MDIKYGFADPFQHCLWKKRIHFVLIFVKSGHGIARELAGPFIRGHAHWCKLYVDQHVCRACLYIYIRECMPQRESTLKLGRYAVPTFVAERIYWIHILLKGFVVVVEQYHSFCIHCTG